MSGRNQQREIDKTFDHLHAFLEKQPEWQKKCDDLLNRYLDAVARQLGKSRDSVMAALFNGPYCDMAWKFLYEEMVAVAWDNQPSCIEEYLGKRGWRESVAGRRFLREMHSTELAIWEVIDTDPGKSVHLRQPGSDNPPIEVSERSASKTLERWTSLVARVISLGDNRIFSGGILSYTPNDGHQLHQLVLDNPAVMEKHGEFSNTAFSLWAMRIILGADSTIPELFNNDRERVVINQYRFPLNSSIDELLPRLQQHPEFHLEANGDDQRQWCWLRLDDDKEISGTVLGILRIGEKYIHLETNSVERGERGVALLKSLFGNDIGQAIGVLENTDSLFATAMDPLIEEPDSELQEQPELLAVIKAHLDRHYLKTLDEAVPLLDNLTPRECAANPDMRPQVIAWLKTLEINNGKSEQSYDFRWIWDELGLSAC